MRPGIPSLPLLLLLVLPGVSQQINTGGSPAFPARAVAILQKHCWSCHGAAASSGLDLRTRESLLRGGERGEVVALGEPDYSLLYQSVVGQRRPYMPPQLEHQPAAPRLTEDEVAVLRRWIEAGVPWPPDRRAGEVRPVRRSAFTQAKRDLWSLRQPVDHPVPSTGDSHPVDAFLRKKWQAAGIAPAARAAPRDLVRRAYFDLIGLPPSPAAIAEFARDPSDQAWRRLIERLLASPEYGVRWARHWLDLVRYADSGGFEFDNDRPNASHYRDWVVRSFNDDKPYDRFVREQLAGDELEPGSIDTRVATGFLRLGPEHNLKNDLTRQLELDDLVSTTSLVFLGLTAGCARCHDHKYDPISQADYYRLQSFFYSTRASDEPLVAPTAVARFAAASREIEARLRPLADEKLQLESPYRRAAILRKLERLPAYMRVAWSIPAADRTAGQRLNVRQLEMIEISDPELAAGMNAGDAQRHRSVLDAMRAVETSRPKPLPSLMVIGEQGREPLPSYLLYGGNPAARGPLVEPGGLEVLAAALPLREIPPPPGAQTSYRRRSLAEWITSPAHPLTARVMVNRIWQHHFGEGLVRTPSDFGLRGQPPTHPELLDWLALRFVESGWSIKQMHRLLMASEAYRVGSLGPPANQSIDPENRLLWRRPPARLDAEVLRDSILAVAGTLDHSQGGPAVHPFIDPSLWQKSSLRVWPGRPEEDPLTWRRSLYVFLKRSISYPLFEAFDRPDPVASCARRTATITAPQALSLMNGGFTRFHARAFGRLLELEAGRDGERSQVRQGFLRALGREPSPAEESESVKVVRELGLANFCLALFNLNEFAFAP